jgi:hypothetical protein
MTRRQSLLVLGVWIAALPLTGFPASWKTVLFILTGFLLIAVYFYERTYGKECTCKVEKEKMNQVFIDNRNSVVQG